MRFLFKTSYEDDIRLAKHPGHVFWYGLLLCAAAVFPFMAGGYWLTQMSMVMIYAIAGLGLMLLSGYTGLMSVGHAAFLGVGAYSHALLVGAGVPFPLALLAAALISGAVGIVVGLPALRVRGIYLAIATLAFGFIVEEVLVRWESLTGGNGGLPVDSPSLFGVKFSSPFAFYWIVLCVTILVTLGIMNLLRSGTGRAFIAIRDSEISAQSMGIGLARYKTISFALSAAIVGIAGGLYAHQMRYLSPEQFGVLVSIDLLILIVIGGLGSLHGAFFGAIFLIATPQVIAAYKSYLPDTIGQAPGIMVFVYGLVLVSVILFEPEGIYGRWRKVRTYLELFPVYRKGMLRQQRTFQKSERLK